MLGKDKLNVDGTDKQVTVIGGMASNSSVSRSHLDCCGPFLTDAFSAVVSLHRQPSNTTLRIQLQHTHRLLLQEVVPVRLHI
jgi:phosphoribosylcarboxyaminoimidazole (NCAIR) mutase